MSLFLTELPTQSLTDILPEELDSIMETVAADLSSAISTVTEFLPEKAALEGKVEQIVSFLPAEIDFLSTAKFLLIFGASSLVVSLLGRTILGKRSSLNHALSSVMGILFIYAATIVAYTFQHWDLSQFLTPLPFVTFSGDYMVVMPVLGTRVPMLCQQILSLVILSFLVNLIDSILPQGKSIIGWYLLRFISVIASMALHFAVRWAFNTYLPEVLVTYAPLALLGILAMMLLLGISNLVLGFLLTVVDPIVGAMYTFFFSNILGKQITKAVFTALILCGIFFVLGYFDYTIVSITVSSLTSYIPVGLVSLVLWYLIGHHL